ncbi:MAG: diacylglycerol/lipid kinase family protein [Lacipirellulaceae bacterium]
MTPEPMPRGRRVLLMVNDRAGSARRRRLADEVTAALGAEGFAVERVAGPEGLAATVSQPPMADGLRAVVALGGDGTFAAALNATPPGTALLLCPRGTENLLAKHLGWKADAGQVARLVRTGEQVRLDAGVAGDRLFSLMASIGFDADVVRRVNERRRGNITHLAYARPIAEALLRYPHQRLVIEGVDTAGEPFSDEGAWLFAVNLPRYASGLRIAPWAEGSDGALDLCLFRRGQLAAGLWYLWHVLRGRHQHLRSVSVRRVTRCVVREAGGAPAAPCQIDGDPHGVTPLELRVASGRITVLVAPEVAARLAAGAQPPVSIVA